MTRPRIFVLPLVASVALIGTADLAHAYTPIPFSEVKSLQGKQVYVADNLELSRKGPVWVFAGEPVTLDSCDKSTSTITLADKSTTNGWRYGRCKVTAADGTTGTLQFKHLSMTPLRFNLRKPGTPAALRRAAFDEAFDTALAMVKFAKAHEAELGSDMLTSTLDNAGVLGEYHTQWHAMADAQQLAQRLHRELVVGSRLSTESAMRDAKHAWAVKADDDHMLGAWTKGVEGARRKQLEAGTSCLGKLNGVRSWGLLSSQTRDELEARSWRRDVQGVRDDQLVALDKENETRLNTRLKRAQSMFQKQLEEAQAMRRKLSW